MTATETRLSCHLRKFGNEVRPPPVSRRDDRIRSLANSFEEITESEEEESHGMISPTCNGRSPYVQSESPFSQRRSNSLTHTPVASPKFSKRVIPPRLIRGFSDPVVRRKGSLNSYLQMSPDGTMMDSSNDLLALPPIPEAATPASPVNAPLNLFKDNN